MTWRVPDPQTLATLDDFEPLGRECLPHMVFEYIAGGAGDEVTLRANRYDFQRIRLRPRALIDVSSIDTSTVLYGQTLDFPILLAPTAYHKLIHPEGEMETVRGANHAGAAIVASTAANIGIAEMAAAATVPVWFQLYTSTDHAFTGDLVRRAEDAGCKALCVTVDAPIRGIRDRDTRAGFDLPPGIERPNLSGLGRAAAAGNPRATGRAIYSPNLDPAVTWREVEWLAQFSRVPVLLKGILTADDSVRALEHGAAGIVVSNHGARTVDTIPSTIEALREVAPAVDGRIPLLVDSGIRRGTDVLKAVALGASAVMIGRPYLYGLAVAGAAGVSRVVEILRRELEMAMALCGRTRLADIDHTLLW